MPLINFKAIEGVLAPEQKRELIEKLTDVTASVYGEGIRQVTWVVIEAVGSGAWGDRRKAGDHRRHQGTPAQGPSGDCGSRVGAPCRYAVSRAATAAGFGPPVAQSSSSAVCTTGRSVAA